MGSKIYQSLSVEDFDQGPTSGSFGFLETDALIYLMQSEKRDGVWVYAETEIPAISRIEPRSAKWIDTHGNPHVAQWWNESVRCAPRSGVDAGDQVIVSFFPWSATQIDLAVFASESPAEASRTPTLRLDDQLVGLRFQDESHFWRWILQTPAAPLIRNDDLVARIAKPTLLHDLQDKQRQHSSHHPARLVYGLIPHLMSIPQIQADIMAMPRIQEEKARIARGYCRLQHPESTKGNNGIFEETQQQAELVLSIAIQMALSGPKDEPEKWYGKPLADFVLYRLKDLLSNTNRRVGTQVKRETNSHDEGLERSSDSGRRVGSKSQKRKRQSISEKELRERLVQDQQTLSQLKEELADVERKIEACK